MNKELTILIAGETNSGKSTMMLEEILSLSRWKSHGADP